MNLRRTLFATAAFAVAFGIFLALDRWGTGGNRDLLDLGTEVERGEELEPYLGASRRRDAAKRALAAKVVARRMSLREAAGHFRRLNEVDPGYPPGTALPPRTEGFYCESVLDYVWMVVADHQQYAAFARYYAEVFPAEPHFLADPHSRHRYYAACAAARAGCGRGRDAADLDEQSRDGFRRQALGWLRTALEARQRLLEQEPEPEMSRPIVNGIVAGSLRHWLRDPHFDGVRGPEALARLPAAERTAWQKLWADVADMLARAEGTTAPGKQAGR
jgi:hypothetical protein